MPCCFRTAGLGLGVPSGDQQLYCDADVVPEICVWSGGMLSVTSESTETLASETGKLVVIFFYPSNEKLYKGNMSKSLTSRCGKCVLQQVKEQQKPEGVGSMYTLDLAVLANCMSLGLFARGLLVAKAESRVRLAGGFVFRSMPAISFPWGHIFVEHAFQPLLKSTQAKKLEVDVEKIPKLLFAVLPRNPET